jgi:fucose 4-O-acetylase-like acetyltransferase
MKTRFDHVDIAKGISILMVAFGHSTFNHSVLDNIQALSLVRMPFFFLMAGLFLSEKRTVRESIILKADSLLKPYFITLIIVISTSIFVHIIQSLQGDVGIAYNIKSAYWTIRQEAWQFYGLIYGTGATLPSSWAALWFLSHLWLLYFLATVLLRFTRYDQLPLPFKLVLLGVFFICGVIAMSYSKQFNIEFLETHYAPGLPFSLDLALISLTYFLLGYTFKDLIYKFRPSLLLLLLTTLVLVASKMYFSPSLSLNGRTITDPFISFIVAISGMYILLCLSRTIEQTNRIKAAFIYMGSMSLFILIFHTYIERKSAWMLSQFMPELPIILRALASLILGIIISLLIGYFVKRYQFLKVFYMPVLSK